MKTLSTFLAATAAIFLSVAALSRAQDPTGGDPNAGAPPPMDQAATGGDQGVPAPPPPGYDQGGAPPPADGQAPPPGAQDDSNPSFDDFYNQLGSQGQWIQTGDYGYVFQPQVSDPNWAPYTNGHWVYTEDGWTWATDEPWGWATYHYGRWVNIDGTGWVWIPGYRWAPAWVSWRYGGGYCGWAPLPPETFVGVDYGAPGVGVSAVFHFGGDVDVAFNIGPGCYNFVPVGCMGAPNYRGYYIDRSRNYVVINNTTNITNITIGGAHRAGNFGHITAFGPPLAQVNAHSDIHVQSVRLATASGLRHAGLSGGTYNVYRPPFTATRGREARPAHVAATIAHPTFNRGDSVTRPLAVNARIAPRQPSVAEVQAAQEARTHAPADARIATENTRVKTPITRPLTSMQHINEARTGSAATSGAYHTQSVTPAQHTATAHATAESPYTGGPERTEPSETHRAETSSGNQYHAPESTPVYHPQSAPVYHQETTPVYHQETAPATHSESPYHSQAVPAETHSSSGGGSYHPAPAPQVHESHEAAPSREAAPSHEAAPPAHGGGGQPQPQGNGGGGPQGGGQRQQH